jgi:hypothetical protein
LSIFRTSTPRKSAGLSKSRKVKFAVSGLALAAAADGTGSAWPSSGAAQQAASASHVSSAARPGAQAPLAAAVRPPQTAGNPTVVLDSLTASALARPLKNHKPVQHRRRVVHLTPRQIARRMLRSFRWSGWQFQWLNLLWSRESSWNVYASNPYSGAYGIPQAVPGSKMATAGSDWESSARTQIRWGMDYIKGRYGSPYGAWEHELATGWY